MAGRRKVLDTSLWHAVNSAAGGRLAEVLAYERRQGTSDRKLTKIIAEQYGVPISVPTIGSWCRALKLPPPVKIRKPANDARLSRPLPPFPDLEQESNV